MKKRFSSVLVLLLVCILSAQAVQATGQKMDMKTYFESPDNCSSVSLSLRLPGEKSSKSISIRSSQNVTFEAKVNSILSSTLVDGDYEFRLTGIRWLSNPVSPYMDYQGLVTINYYTAFGY